MERTACNKSQQLIGDGCSRVKSAEVSNLFIQSVSDVVKPIKTPIGGTSAGENWLLRGPQLAPQVLEPNKKDPESLNYFFIPILKI